MIEGQNWYQRIANVLMDGTIELRGLGGPKKWEKIKFWAKKAVFWRFFTLLSH